MLMEEKGKQYQHSTIMHNPPNVNGTRQSGRVIWKVFNTTWNEQCQAFGINSVNCAWNKTQNMSYKNIDSCTNVQIMYAI